MKTDLLHGLLEIRFCPPVASSEFYELIIQFGINFGVLLIIARFMYYKWNRKAEYMFAMFITGIIVFMICALLRWVQLELGLVLGLFAIFAIIRFRTINVPIKEMAYLFMVVGISAVNALLPISGCIQWILLSNSILILVTFVLETAYFRHKISCRTITISHTELLKPSQRKLLLEEIKNLTELDILRLEIGKVDYIKKHAQINIYFTGDDGSCANEPISMNDDD
jgi:hypothetical protein